MGGYLRVRALLGMFGFRASQVPHPVWALVVCAVFTAVGVAVLDDYGVTWDEFPQREIALETISYVLGQDDELLRDHDKFYGTTFEMPLLIVERVLGLQDDTRAFLLSRHILSHLFFIAGGFFCYLLIRRLFGSTVIALFAMLLFLLHPRLYAESFVNTKDLPLAAMFMVALFLTHRAFSKNTVGAFLLCGLAVGILINIRILGVVLFAAVPAVRALDLLFDSGGVGRKHALITGSVFALAAMLALYATLPYLHRRKAAVFAPIVHRREVYNNPVLSVVALNLSAVDDATADAYRQIYRDAVTGSPVASGSGFDLYHNEPEKTLIYVNESCEPEDVANRFVLSLIPFDANNLPVYVKQRGVNQRTLYFDFGEKGVKFDGKCLMVFQLPEYPIFQISIGHRLGGQNHFWGNLTELSEVERIIENAGDPVIRGKFDVYLGENILLYSREPCAPADISDKFFLHLIPVDQDDLPKNRRQDGFDNLDFNFAQAGGIAEGKCSARVVLPDYPITRIRTGQYVRVDSGYENLWSGEIRR